MVWRAMKYFKHCSERGGKAIRKSVIKSFPKGCSRARLDHGSISTVLSGRKSAGFLAIRFRSTDVFPCSQRVEVCVRRRQLKV